MKIRILLMPFVVLLMASLSLSCTNVSHVKVVRLPLKTPADIRPVNDSLVVPYVYTNVVSLNKLPGKEKKEKFFHMLLPAVLAAKAEMDLNRKRVEFIAKKHQPSPVELHLLDSLKQKYKAVSVDQLIQRLHSAPVSIVLAQAAIESGWGSSRFFIKANNPFGIWSFDTTHNRIEASSNRNGKKIYLRKFDDLEEAIDEYFVMMATRRPFARFQQACLTIKDPFKLIPFLGAYSERGPDYIRDLAKMIRTNHLEKYDHYTIHPKYLH
jgi:Bax protein